MISSKKKWTDCDEPHLTSNKKMQPIQWTKQPTGTLVAAGSLWPLTCGCVLTISPYWGAYPTLPK
jgi:hypothetical protein